ncbi:MAG: hypothetical protein DDT33_01663 [Firmicutes bacterium]|nr:hypothetical protein [Bacillota bacterium]
MTSKTTIITTRTCTRGELRKERREMKEVEEKKFMVLPPRPGVCQECAADHSPDEPHNKNSLYYQMAFHARSGRWPTWEDAMAHCEEETKELWREELKLYGELDQEKKDNVDR